MRLLTSLLLYNENFRIFYLDNSRLVIVLPVFCLRRSL